MALLSLTDLSFGYSHPPLLDGVSVNIERGERIGLVGRNGAGKSTILRLIAGLVAPDDGTIVFSPGTKVAYLTQDVPVNRTGTIFDCVAGGVPEVGDAVADYHRLSLKMSTGTLTDAEHEAFEAAAHRLSAAEQWDAVQAVERVLSELKLDSDPEFQSLSAGMKRRVLLGRALASSPEMLLLDEPTNHLDIDSIIWLQDFLLRYDGTLMFVTHDRAFLQALATRIIEVDRGRLFDWTCDYATFLKRRDAQLEAEAHEQALFDKKLAEEERWIRQGIKARRTRNEGRVRALEQKRRERSERREKIGTGKMQLQEAERSGNVVIRAEGIHFAYDDRPIVDDLTVTVFRGDRIGLIGPNGVGKSTLLKLILGELQPQSGTVRLGTNLKVSYFDQLRAQLDETASARENVAHGAEYVEINGQRRHVLGYLQDFLFSPDRAQTRVSFLSGGERNRLLLARLFTLPSNLLVLDEPTNDLDAETLDLLEDLLDDYSGTVLLVSHDRAFLNNVATSTLVFSGEGRIREYSGGYDDWLRQRPAAAIAVSVPANTSPPTAGTSPITDQKPAARKLSFKEQRELEGLPERILELEERQQQIHGTVSDGKFYQQDQTLIAETLEELKTLEAEISAAYARWEELETLS